MKQIADIKTNGIDIEVANCLLPTGKTIYVFRAKDDAEWTYIDDVYQTLLKDSFLADVHMAAIRCELTPQDQLDTI